MPLDASTLDPSWLAEGLIIDNFAGGGGASTGIELALGRSPDVAINHDAEAVALHAANHPDTLHLCQNVWKADPRDVVRQASALRCALLGIPFRILPVRFAWFSPDCKHFSKAKGSKPVEKGIRGLAWVVVHWAKLTLPDVIALENVEEFKDWGPLVPNDEGKLVPSPLPIHRGRTFKDWVRALRRLGYVVDHRELRACDYGAPTIRKRLFVVARRDGKPITWAEPTHARDGAGGLLPWRTAAECIDWHLDCPSIFDRKRPLAENTLRRVARGVMRYVVNAEKPFIVGVGGRMGQSPERPVDVPMQTITAKGDSAVVEPFIAGLAHGDSGGRREYRVDEPLTTIHAGGGNHAVVQPFISRVDQTSAVERNGIAPIGEPLRTVHTSNPFALIAPLTHHGGDRSHPVDEPAKTITAAHRGEMALIVPHVTKFRGGATGSAADEPMGAQTTENHRAVVEPFVARIGQTGGGGKYVNRIDEPVTTITSKAEHLVIAPHVTKFRGGATGSAADTPMPTVTANSFIKRPGGAAPLGLVSASLATYYGAKPGEKSRGAPVDEPLRTQTTENRHAVVAAFMAQHNTGNDGHPVEIPVSTIVGKGCTQGVVEAKAAMLTHAYTSNTAGGNGALDHPTKTILTGGHTSLVELDLSAEDMEGAQRVAAFIAKYYGQGDGQPVDEPLHTVTTKDRFCLVTVNGWPIVDIGLRMLQPRELYRAQGFPTGYVIDGPGPTGKPMTKTAQVRMCGNSVCPPIAQAIARALVFGSAPAAEVMAAD
jgi:DNA (cytosine-5)-methyltransferase 1